MVILVLNCGSSSIKYQVIDMEAQSSKLLAKGLVERIGIEGSNLVHKKDGREFKIEAPSRFPITRRASAWCFRP